MENFRRHVQLCREVGLQFVPKYHLSTHLWYKTPWFGNPDVYACFIDEHDNKTLKAVSRGIHQLTWEAGVLHRIDYVMKRKSH